MTNLILALRSSNPSRTAVVAALGGAPARDEAELLARRLRGFGRFRAIHALIEGDRIVFTGGRHGDHSLALGASSRERVIAHFIGYLVGNGAVEAQVGDVVDFPSASAWKSGGERTGTVVRRTATRALVSYRYKSGKLAAPKWVPLYRLVFVRRPATEQ